MQDSSNVYTNSPQKGLVTDLHENLVSKELWTFARNAQINSHLGQIQFIQNEPSNYKCVDLPYKPIGFIKLLNNRWAVFSTDNTHSEIGIFDDIHCSYSKVINADCLAFNTSHLIQGVSKEMYDCSETVYWTDGNSPRRFLNLSSVPYGYNITPDNCNTKVFNSQVDCIGLLMEKQFQVPCINAYLGTGGDLHNGVYQVGIAYSVNKSRVTEFYGISRPISIWTHENVGQALDVSIDNIDTSFDEYELILISTVAGVPDYQSLGFYSTSVKTHHISSPRRADYLPLSLAEIITPRPRYTHADIITANDQYLLYGGVKTTSEIDYQLLAMNILAEYYVMQVPSDYYSKGGTMVGYNRDESYAFGIQWLSLSGEWSAVYHIPGRKAKGDLSNSSGPDAFELSHHDNCAPKTTVKKYQVQNTAGDMILPTETIKNCDGKIIGMGKMAYMETSEQYPNNHKMFGHDSCKPIRHHKFPDNCKTHIHDSEGKNIFILGIRFRNIEHPKDINGNKRSDVVGYRIVRGNRENNKTIQAKGICTNVRAYTDNSQEVLYSNYPMNDLSPDQFISSEQTFYKGGKEKGFKALTEYKTDQFNFYSPATLFSHISLGDEIDFLTEESARVDGYFEQPYKHPMEKLVTEFDVYFALIVGAIDGYLATRGKRISTKYVDPKRAIDDPTGLTQYPRVVTTTGTTATGTLTIVGSTALIAGNAPLAGTASTKELTHYEKSDADHTHIAMEQYAADTISQLNGVIATGNKIDKVAATILKGLASVGIFSFFALETARKTLDSIYEFSGWQQYALQYNAHGLFTDYSCVSTGNKRRKVLHYQYLYDGINTVDGVKFNNFKKANSVFIKTSDVIKEPTVKDNTRQTVNQFGICDSINKHVQTTATVYYTSIKRRISDQYGSIDSIEYLDTGGCMQSLKTDTKGEGYQTDVIFGGDTFISKFAIRNTHHYFSQYLKEGPNGFIIDYRLYRNVGYPRYWMDSTPYDMSEFISTSPKKSNLPQNKHNLSCEGNSSFDNITVVKNRYFYLFNSGVMEFFVESEMNLDYRDWKGETPSFYSRHNQNLSTIFQSGDNIEKREEFIYDRTYSKQLVENSAKQQRIDYDPTIDATCFQYLKNRVIYSLPAFKDQKSDNWKVNLVNNFYDFPLAEFGSLTAMHPVDNQQVIFLFDKASPYITVGRDELQLDGSGKKITIGDGGLFAREPRPIAYTDYYYGNSQSKYAFVNTQFGSFYPSQRQGRIFGFNGKLDEVSRNGMHWWFQTYMPSKLLEQFPTFKEIDNPLTGTGMLSVFDNTEERYYLTKRDYSVKAKYAETMVYDAETNTFSTDNIKADLTDTKYFDDASWTISYSPKDQSFISYHDWHPDWMLQTENHFMTVKQNAIWKHNDQCNSFSNFYGTQYPFAIEYLINNGQNNEILRSLEYYLEVGKYFNKCRDYNMMLDGNFTDIIISNSEQISGLLKPNLQSKDDLSMDFDYPKINTIKQTIDILYNKEEQKTRVNQFWDITKDRGEFTGKQVPLWITQPNGYIRDINLDAVDYEKEEQKKFRNLWHKVLLSNLDDGSRKFIFKFANAKLLNSQR